MTLPTFNNNSSEKTNELHTSAGLSEIITKHAQRLEIEPLDASNMLKVMQKLEEEGKYDRVTDWAKSSNMIGQIGGVQEIHTNSVQAPADISVQNSIPDVNDDRAQAARDVIDGVFAGSRFAASNDNFNLAG